MFCIQVFPQPIFNPIPLFPLSFRTVEDVVTHDHRQGEIEVTHLRMRERYETPLPERSKVLGAQKTQKRTPNKTQKKSYIYYICKECFLPNPYYLSSLILFLHKKHSWKFMFLGVSSSSPRHRLLFSLSVLENAFQRLSLVLVSKRILMSVPKSKLSPTKKQSHLFHLPQMIFRILKLQQ